MKRIKFMQNLVVSYRSFMEVKYGDNHEAYKLGIQLQSVIGCLLMTTVGILIGIFTNQIENLYYVFFMMNTVVIGSFVLNKVTLEKKIQFKNKITYDYRGELVYQTFTLTGILSIAQLLIFTLHTNFVEHILFITLLLIVSGVSNYVCRFIYHYVVKTEPHRVVRNGVFLYIVFLLSRYVFGVHSFSYSYIIMFGSGMFVYLLKYLYTLLSDAFLEYSTVISFVFVIIFLIFGALNPATVNVVRRLDINFAHMNSTLMNTEETLPISDGYINDDFILYETSDYIIKEYRYDDYVELYDKHYNLMKTYDMEDYFAYRVNIINDDIYIYYRINQDVYNPYSGTNDTVPTFKHYKVGDDLELIELFEMDTDDSRTILYEDQGNLYFTGFGGADNDQHYLYLLTSEGGTYQDIPTDGPNEIILQNKQCVYYRKDNRLFSECGKYEDGYIYGFLEYTSGGPIRIGLYTIENYVNGLNYEAVIEIDNYHSHGDLYVSEDYIMIGIEEYITKFRWSEYDDFYINDYLSKVYYIFDKDYHLNHKVVDSISLYPGLQLIDNQFVWDQRDILNEDNPFIDIPVEIPTSLRYELGFMLLCLIPIGNILIIPKGWWMD